MDTALATFQPSGISSDFNEKSDRLCANSSTWSSHSFWICVWSQWPTENWWFHPVALTCVSRSIKFSSPLFNFKERICSNECSSIRARSSACHTKYGCCCAILCFMICLILCFFFLTASLLLSTAGWALGTESFYLYVCMVCTEPSYEPQTSGTRPSLSLQCITFIILKGALRSGDFSASLMEPCMFFIKIKITFSFTPAMFPPRDWGLRECSEPESKCDCILRIKWERYKNTGEWKAI